jgi:hypothetical protein
MTWVFAKLISQATRSPLRYFILDGPADWPEGCCVTVEPISDEAETLGITEQLWPQSPEAIKKWLAWFDSIEPIEMTAEEEAEWQAAREAQRAYERAKFEERWSKSVL